jgi:ribosomal-protein-alanine N-acetyltransferase
MVETHIRSAGQSTAVYRIRRAISADVPAIAALERQCFQTPWPEAEFERELGENPRAVYMVAEEAGGELIAYAGLWEILGEGHITNVAVAAHRRRQGVGREILKVLFSKAQELGVFSYTLEVRPSNEDAIRLYQGLGFRIAGRRKAYYEDNREDAAIMWMRDWGGHRRGGQDGAEKAAAGMEADTADNGMRGEGERHADE